MNVQDKYKNLSIDQIKNSILSNTNPFSVLSCFVSMDINIGALLRTAHFFGCKRYYYLSNRKKWNRKTSVGTYKYTEVIHLKDPKDALTIPDKLIGIECNKNLTTQTIYNYSFQKNSCFVFGSESDGIPEEILEYCYEFLTIPNFGATRSLNVSVSAGIVMSEFVKGMKNELYKRNTR